MAQASEEITDETPLDGKRIDVEARIGWLMRVNRESAGVTQREMSRRLGELGLANCSTSVLNRFERDGARRRRLIEGYEQALELSAGSLVSVIQMLCESFSYAPPEWDSPRLPRTLQTVDQVTGPVLEAMAGDPRSVRGGQWMSFARASRDVGLMLPTSLVGPIFGELLTQVSMAVDGAFRTRYSALQDLHRSGYATLLQDHIIEYVDTPGCAVTNDLVSSSCEVPNQRLFDWLLEMLVGDDLPRARAARIGFEQIATRAWATREHWEQVAKAMVSVLTRPDLDRDRREGLARLWAHLPIEQRREIRRQVPGRIEPGRKPVSWEPSRRNNAHFNFAHRLASIGCEAAGLNHQPMADRLVFEMLYDPRSSRSFTSLMLLASTPLAPALVRACIDLGVRRGPDRATVNGCVEALASLPSDWTATELMELIPVMDRVVQQRLLICAGHSGVRLPEDMMRGFVADPMTRSEALYSLAFTAHPLLVELRRSPDVDLRLTAEWWARQGAPVLR